MSKSSDSSWQAVLQKIIRQPGERQRLITALGINPMTLNRWLKDEYQPNRAHLTALLRHVPALYRQEMREAIELDHPDFDGWASEGELVRILPEFYIEILDNRAGLMEAKRNREIVEKVLNQALLQLDPHKQGMAITLAQCMPPRADGKIHSLRERAGRGTPPWTADLENFSIFLAMESLAGYVVQNQHPASIEDISKEKLLPAIQDEFEVSAAAVPLLYEGNIAGCLLASSTVIGHFTRQRLELMGDFANLLTLGMEPADFYDHSCVQLGILRYESAAEQRALLRTFRDRVQQLMIQYARNRTPIRYKEAEEQVWAELEEEVVIG
jgi:GAF domain